MKSIVAAVDFSKASRRVLDVAVQLGKELNAEVIAVFVRDTSFLRFAIREGVNISQADSKILKSRVQSHIDDKFAQLLQKHRNSEVRIRAVTVRGIPYREIIRMAARHSAGLIVTGTRGRNAAAETLLGSTARDLVRCSTCPVITVRAQAPTRRLK
jgi:nucleotide-binding universal stress UspA family protein